LKEDIGFLLKEKSANGKVDFFSSLNADSGRIEGNIPNFW